MGGGQSAIVFVRRIENFYHKWGLGINGTKSEHLMIEVGDNVVVKPAKSCLSSDRTTCQDPQE